MSICGTAAAKSKRITILRNPVQQRCKTSYRTQSQGECETILKATVFLALCLSTTASFDDADTLGFFCHHTVPAGKCLNKENVPKQLRRNYDISSSQRDCN